MGILENEMETITMGYILGLYINPKAMGLHHDGILGAGLGLSATECAKALASKRGCLLPVWRKMMYALLGTFSPGWPLQLPWATLLQI